MQDNEKPIKYVSPKGMWRDVANQQEETIDSVKPGNLWDSREEAPYDESVHANPWNSIKKEHILSADEEVPETSENIFNDVEIRKPPEKASAENVWSHITSENHLKEEDPIQTGNSWDGVKLKPIRIQVEEQRPIVEQTKKPNDAKEKAAPKKVTKKAVVAKPKATTPPTESIALRRLASIEAAKKGKKGKSKKGSNSMLTTFSIIDSRINSLLDRNPSTAEIKEKFATSIVDPRLKDRYFKRFVGAVHEEEFTCAAFSALSDQGKIDNFMFALESIKEDASKVSLMIALPENKKGGTFNDVLKSLKSDEAKVYMIVAAVEEKHKMGGFFQLIKREAKRFDSPEATIEHFAELVESVLETKPDNMPDAERSFKYFEKIDAGNETHVLIRDFKDKVEQPSLS